VTGALSPQSFPDLIKAATYYLELGSAYGGNLIDDQKFHMAQLFQQPIQRIPRKVSPGIVSVCVKYTVDGASAVTQISCSNS
jgi:hypothetical protein